MMIDWLMDEVVDWFSSFVRGVVNQLWALLVRTVFTTPDVTGLSQVRTINARSLVVVDTCFVLAVVVAGIAVMLRESVQVRYGLSELVPRLVIGFVAANVARPLCHEMIVFANAATRALTGESIMAEGSFLRLLTIVNAALVHPTAALLTATIAAVIAVLVAALLVLWIVRVITLIVLVGIAPVALACHALPWTEAVAAAWWRAFGGCLCTVTAQAVTMHTGLTVLLSPQANRAALGLPASSHVFDLLIVLCLLWMTVNIRGIVRRHFGGGAQHRNALGVFVRYTLVHKVTGGLQSRARSVVRASWAHRSQTARRPSSAGRTWPSPGTERTGRRNQATAQASGVPSRTGTGWPGRTVSRKPPGRAVGTGWPAEHSVPPGRRPPAGDGPAAGQPVGRTGAKGTGTPPVRGPSFPGPSVDRPRRSGGQP